MEGIEWEKKHRKAAKNYQTKIQEVHDYSP
jgi:hypothetical protein